MADRYRGTMYVGVTANLSSRVFQHRTGGGSDFCRRYRLDRLVWAEQMPSIADAIEHEKRVKRWRRDWKFDLIEKSNPDGAICLIRSHDKGSETPGQARGDDKHTGSDVRYWSQAAGRVDKLTIQRELIVCIAGAK